MPTARRRGGKVAIKVCHTCKRRKPLTAFYRRAASADGRDVCCADCRAGYWRRWFAANQAAYNSRHQAWREAHREHVRAYNREYQRRRRALMRAGKSKAKRGR